MIYDQIENRECYRHLPRLFEALERLAGILPETMPEQSFRGDDGALLYHPIHLRVKDESECLYEAHRRFIDLHYILSGHERVAVAKRETLSERTPYDDERDIAFYEGNAEQEWILRPGDFLYCLPQDAHKVAMRDECAGTEEVSKMVVKIPAASDGESL